MSSFPARHELGMMIEVGRSADAEKVFRQDLIFWPENGYALEGLRAALAVQGKKTDAAALDARVLEAWKHAERTEMAGK